MSEVFILLGFAILLFMAWRLYQAKQYNKFIDWLNGPIKHQVGEQLKAQLIEKRCALTPNNDDHIKAASIFYLKYPIRIFQLAIQFGVIKEDWLAVKKHHRFAQHLNAIQSQYKIIAAQYVGEDFEGEEPVKQTKCHSSELD